MCPPRLAMLFVGRITLELRDMKQYVVDALHGTSASTAPWRTVTTTQFVQFFRTTLTLTNLVQLWKLC